MNRWFQKQWVSYTPWHILLIPLSWAFGTLVYLRTKLYKIGWLKSTRLGVPVIVVGNINVGGTGKTPVVIWLAEQLQQQGFTVGIISRGYGGYANQVTPVFANSNPAEVGDEPVLIAKRTACPMFVGANRVAAGQALLQAHPNCNIIISDDGLQHYRLQRDVEIALINSSALQTSNQQLLPAGALREKISRLQQVNVIIDSALHPVPIGALQPPSFNMQLQGDVFEAVNGLNNSQPASYFAGKALVAIAGIGNPERFFNKLTDLGLQFERQIFADHHAFTAQDLAQYANKTILMTEKDAVKCRAFATTNAWALPVNAVVSHDLLLTILSKI